MRIVDPDKGLFTIGVVAEMLGLSQKQLRVYESKGVITPTRSGGNHRLYSQRDVERLTFIHYLASVEKVNLAGIRFIQKLMADLPQKQRERIILSAEEAVEKLTSMQREAYEENVLSEDASLDHDPVAMDMNDCNPNSKEESKPH